ncbi:MAG: toxin-antitoxin (TA) system antitoxin [Bacteroidetes bacterium]|nr:toxin-antitoxin (TA) system antitoxin [Bacteroidota bacterium]
MTVTLTEAQKRLRELLAKAKAGEEVFITGDGGTTKYRVTVEPSSTVTRRTPGLGKGTIKMASDFDAELPDSFWLGEQ